MTTFLTEGKACCDHSGQSLWNGSNSKCDSNFKVVNRTTNPRPSVNRVIEMVNVDEPHNNANDRDNLYVEKTSKKDLEVFFRDVHL